MKIVQEIGSLYNVTYCQNSFNCVYIKLKICKCVDSLYRFFFFSLSRFLFLFIYQAEVVDGHSSSYQLGVKCNVLHSIEFMLYNSTFCCLHEEQVRFCFELYQHQLNIVDFIYYEISVSDASVCSSFKKRRNWNRFKI